MDHDNASPSGLLLQLGLSPTETTVYLTLLEMEAVSIRKVAEKSGINRGTVYETLKSLVHWGLVSVRQTGQREYYSAESPDKIFDIIQDKRKELWQTLQGAKQIVPTLLAKNARPQGSPIVRYYEGDEGAVAVLRDVLQTCKVLPNPEFYAYSGSRVRQYLYTKFPRFTERRISEAINVKVIAIGPGGGPAPYSERRWMPESPEYTTSNYGLIYGDKLGLISISSDFTPYGVVIEDKGVAAMQRLIFEQVWKSLEP